MKALSIHQPFAALICLPETDPRHKRVENRTWPTTYRGRLLIHASKTRQGVNPYWGLELNSGIKMGAMHFGKIVAAVTLIDCLHIDQITASRVTNKFAWLVTHEHTYGPWCWILKDVSPLRVPFAFKGNRRIFNVPDHMFKEPA